jgi:LysW-gamma-L-lysine carboxypeptidase
MKMNPVAFLQELVSIPSISGEEEAMSKHLLKQMIALGFRAYRDDASNVIGEMGNPDAERVIMLLGHMDTVPPFLPVYRKGNKLYGRGAVDAKGPLAAFVLAAAQVAPRLETTRVVVIGAVQEEDPRGQGAHYLLKTIPMPDCVIIGEPSHWEGITLGYKGILSANYRWVQPGSHSAANPPGPAEKAVTFWNRLMDHAERANNSRMGHFDTLDPALREFHTVKEGTGEGVMMNIVLRLPPAFDVQGLKQTMIDWSDGAELVFPGYEPAYQGSKNTPLVRALLKSIRDEGGRPRFKLKTGTSDMNVVGAVWDCPMLAYGPGDSMLDHTPEEHIDVREFRRSIEVLTRALEILAA